MPRDTRTARTPNRATSASSRAITARAAVTFTALTSIVIATLFAARAVLMPFVIAGLIAYLLAPLVDRAARLHVPRWIVVLLAYAASFAVNGVPSCHLTPLRILKV